MNNAQFHRMLGHSEAPYPTAQPMRRTDDVALPLHPSQWPFHPSLAPGWLPHPPMSRAAPMPPPPPVLHKVWIVDCKACGGFLTNRGMKVSIVTSCLVTRATLIPFPPGGSPPSTKRPAVLNGCDAHQLFCPCYDSRSNRVVASILRANLQFSPATASSCQDMRMPDPDALVSRLWYARRIHDRLSLPPLHVILHVKQPVHERASLRLLLGGNRRERTTLRSWRMWYRHSRPAPKCSPGPGPTSASTVSAPASAVHLRHPGHAARTP